MQLNYTFWSIFTGGSRTAATSKMELFVIVVNGFPSDVSVILFQPLRAENGENVS